MKVSFCYGVSALAAWVIVDASGLSAHAASTPPEPVWNIKEGIQTPESAYWDSDTQTLYVANVAGNPAEKDGKGWISKLDGKGKVIQAQWITGLDAPKGLRSSGNTLWMTNIDEVVAVDIPSGKISRRIPIPGAKFLNDTAVGPGGEIYVADTMASKIYVIQGDKPSVFVQGEKFESPNGLLVQDGKLIVAAWGKGAKPDFSTRVPGHLYSIDLKSKKKKLITKKPLGHLDGLESAGNGNYWVSDWMAGKVFRVDGKDGSSQIVFEGFKGSADLGYMSGSKMLVVPRMGEDQISAYKVP